MQPVCRFMGLCPAGDAVFKLIAALFIAAISLACTSEPAVTITVKPSSEAVAIIHEHCQAVASGKTEISLNHFTQLCGVVVATDAQVELHQALEQ